MFSKSTNNNVIAFTSPWLKVTNLENNQFSDELASIYHKHSQDNRWILMVNPDEDPVNELVNKHHLTSHKILRVNAQGKKIGIDKIEQTLAQGNCAAIVWCNPGLSDEAMDSLTRSAQHGNTRCIILNKSAEVFH